MNDRSAVVVDFNNIQADFLEVVEQIGGGKVLGSYLRIILQNYRAYTAVGYQPFGGGAGEAQEFVDWVAGATLTILTERERRVVDLCYMQGARQDIAARCLGVSRRTAQIELYRACYLIAYKMGVDRIQGMLEETGGAA